MRDSFQHLKWILIVLVAVFVLFVFVDWGAGGMGGGTTNATQAFAARVNGETITINEYSRMYKQYTDMYSQMYGQQGQFTPEMAQAMGLPKQVLDSLIDQRLMSQEGARLNLAATPEEVRRKLLESPTFLQDGKFVGMELYNRYVTGPLGYPSAAAFEEALARDITLQKVQSAFENSIVISPKAAEAEYRRMNEAAKIRYVFYPAARDLATVSVTDAEVQAFYKANQSRYQHGEQRQIRYLLADAGKLRAQIQPSDAELRKRYDANRQEYKTQEAAHVLHILVKVEPGSPAPVDAAAKAKADSLVAQLRAGGNFAQLASANSQDPSSAGNGGDMGWVERGQTVEPFDRAIFTLPLNSIDVVKSAEYGYHIVKIVERRPAGFRSFEEVKPELQARVADEMAQDQARSEITRIAALLRQKKPENVQAFVAQANDRVASFEAPWFGKNDQIPGLGMNQALSQWVFSAKEGDVGEVTQTQRGMIIPYVSGVRAAGVPDLKEIRAKVEEDAKLGKAKTSATRALQAAMAGAPTVDAVAAKLGLTATEASVNRQQGQIAGINGNAPELIDAAINGRLGAVNGPLAVGDGAVVFQITEQKKVTPQELAQNRVSYIDTLRQQQARSLRAVLVERLRKEARVEVNDELIRPTSTPAGL
ncbi:MAG TPA: peptidyl-prolyl cis-trans isomerase [Thermoanaerobaculia bacterium]